MKSFHQEILRIIDSLDAGTRHYFEQQFTLQYYSKGEALLQKGEVCQNSFLIEEGIVRKFYLSEDKEITSEMVFPGEMAVSVHSYLKQAPAEEYLQAITPCTVRVIPFLLFEEMRSKHPTLAQTDILILEQYATWLESRVKGLQCLSATERYELLLNEQPHIIRQVPLTYIASYLGVKLETLSRIRRQII